MDLQELYFEILVSLEKSVFFPTAEARKPFLMIAVTS